MLNGIIIYTIVGCIIGMIVGYAIDTVIESEEMRKDFEEKELMNMEMNKTRIMIFSAILWIPGLVYLLYIAATNK